MWKRSEGTKKVDCQKVEAWLIAYLKDGLSPQHRQMVEEHLAACEACARSVQQAQILESQLRLQAAHHTPTLSADASARIHERVYRRMRRGLIMQRTVRLVGVAVAVVAIVVLAAGAMALWQGRPSERRRRDAGAQRGGSDTWARYGHICATRGNGNTIPSRAHPTANRTSIRIPDLHSRGGHRVQSGRGRSQWRYVP
jgi:hypothetical protein